MAARWLLYVGFTFALGFGTLLALASSPFIGLFLGAVIWWAARSAVDPAERDAAVEDLRRRCDQLPFCDCNGRPAS